MANSIESVVAVERIVGGSGIVSLGSLTVDGLPGRGADSSRVTHGGHFSRGLRRQADDSGAARSRLALRDVAISDLRADGEGWERIRGFASHRETEWSVGDNASGSLADLCAALDEAFGDER